MSDLPYTVKITEKEWLTQDVIRFQVEKSVGSTYRAGHNDQSVQFYQRCTSLYSEQVQIITKK